jgi:hypothetical protein
MQHWRIDIDRGNEVGLLGLKTYPNAKFHNIQHGLVWERRMRWNVRRWIGNVGGNYNGLRIVSKGELWY